METEGTLIETWRRKSCKEKVGQWQLRLVPIGVGQVSSSTGKV